MRHCTRSAMKFWRNAAALLTVFHPKTTHTGNHSTPKDVKNEGRPGKVYENKGQRDKMPEIISDICARLKPFLQKIAVSSFPNNCKAGRAARRSRNRRQTVGAGLVPALPRAPTRDAPTIGAKCLLKKTRIYGIALHSLWF